jgi:hypothetical protein
MAGQFDRSGFRAWTKSRDLPKAFGDLSARRRRDLRQQWSNLQDVRGTSSTVPPLVETPTTPQFNNPIQSNGGWFDPNSQYGSSYQPGEWATTPVADIFLEENPDAAWMRYTTGLGIDPNTAEGQWARSQLSNAKTGWTAALATNPQLRQRDYFNSLNIRNMFRNLSARERGENPGLIAPAARTISRGYG